MAVYVTRQSQDWVARDGRVMEEVWNVDRTGVVEGSGRRNVQAANGKQQLIRGKETLKVEISFWVNVFEVL